MCSEKFPLASMILQNRWIGNIKVDTFKNYLLKMDELNLTTSLEI